jgi:hypothetical protein
VVVGTQIVIVVEFRVWNLYYGFWDLSFGVKSFEIYLQGLQIGVSSLDFF